MATFTHLVMASFLLESESESVLVAHLCLTLCNPTDCSMLDSSVHGILQAKILEWVAVSFSRGSSQPKDETWVSCVSCMAGRLFTGSHKSCSRSAPGEKQGPALMAPDLLVVRN